MNTDKLPPLVPFAGGRGYHGGPKPEETESKEQASSPKKPPRVSKEEWQIHRETIIECYAKSDLRETIDIMAQKHGFLASEKALSACNDHDTGCKVEPPAGLVNQYTAFEPGTSKQEHKPGISKPSSSPEASSQHLSGLVTEFIVEQVLSGYVFVSATYQISASFRLLALHQRYQSSLLDSVAFGHTFSRDRIEAQQSDLRGVLQDEHHHLIGTLCSLWTHNEWSRNKSLSSWFLEHLAKNCEVALGKSHIITRVFEEMHAHPERSDPLECLDLLAHLPMMFFHPRKVGVTLEDPTQGNTSPGQVRKASTTTVSQASLALLASQYSWLAVPE
ncbi:hypothetical protein BN1723_006922 [Verticillium longisporum]|uniref:Clr5 domain-containing protein n=1 Tax=Verticillium longisporum TaxID=100787 RepID=A0A0G4NIH2_VERLO|nr:hypothetical protein BN1723_006922 [Verticillium longisporum]